MKPVDAAIACSAGAIMGLVLLGLATLFRPDPVVNAPWYETTNLVDSTTVDFVVTTNEVASVLTNLVEPTMRALKALKALNITNWSPTNIYVREQEFIWSSYSVMLPHSLLSEIKACQAAGGTWEFIWRDRSGGVHYLNSEGGQ